MSQSSLFPDLASASGVLDVPPVIERALREGATLAVSISGGKDSQAMLQVLAPWFRAQGFSGHLFAIHADLGRAEWEQTPAFVERLAAEAGVPLTVVRRPKGDLVARIEERMEATRESGVPFWPSSAARYCTAEMKRDPIDVRLRGKGAPSEVIISAEGVRADESPARARKPAVEMRSRISAAAFRGMELEEALSARQPEQRLALNWRPLLHWNEADVWRACGTDEGDLRRRRALYRLGAYEDALDGWPASPVYVLGNQRLSCALCVLASQNDLRNGAEHNPALYRKYLEMEIAGGATFKHGWSLFDLDLDPNGQAAKMRDEVLAGGVA